MTDPSPKTIIWLEDRPSTVSAELAAVESVPNVELKLISSLTSLHNLANPNTPQNWPRIAAIIVDIQLFGITDLRPFRTDRSIHFSPNESGIMIVDHILRIENSPYAMIPLLVFTVQTQYPEDLQKLEQIRKRGGVCIDWLEKKSGMKPDPAFAAWIRRVLAMSAPNSSGTCMEDTDGKP